MPSIFNETNLCYKAVKNNSDYILYVNGCADDEYCPYGKAEAYCKKIIQKKMTASLALLTQTANLTYVKMKNVSNEKTGNRAKYMLTVESFHFVIIIAIHANL